MGSKEGMFRYADPSDGDDALCSTLSELTDSVVAMGGAFPLQLTLPHGCLEFNRSLPRQPQTQHAAEDTSLTSSSLSNSITKTVMMEKGRGSVDVFIHALDHNNDLEVSLDIPATQSSSTSHFQIPMVYNTSSINGSDDHSSVLMEWEAHLTEEVAREALQLGKIYKETREGNQSSSSSGAHGANRLESDFYLHAALLLQRARCLEVYRVLDTISIV